MNNTYRKQHLFNLDFVAADNFDTIIHSLIVEDTPANELPIVITPNVDLTVHLNKNKTLLPFFQKARFILPDGAPIILFSKLLDKPLKKRLAGSDLFPLIWRASLHHHKKVLMILPNEAVKNQLAIEYPTAQFYIPPFFDTTNEAVEIEAQHILPLIKIHQPDFVFLGLRYPKQEMLIKNLYEKLNAASSANATDSLQAVSPERDSALSNNIKMPIFFNLGASYEFYTGLKSRAPRWMQKTGLEWLHRFLSEPKRTFKRYFYDDLYIFVLLAKEIFRR